MEAEPGGGEEWSPIREVGNQAADVASVLMATEGANSAILGLVRGVIVPTVVDDQEMALVPALIQKGGTRRDPTPFRPDDWFCVTSYRCTLSKSLHEGNSFNCRAGVFALAEG
jgi:hypothetical protein